MFQLNEYLIPIGMRLLWSTTICKHCKLYSPVECLAPHRPPPSIRSLTKTDHFSIQITACTGQPVLANNVTQAQAFCIATACLQVPVLTKFDLINKATTKPSSSAATIQSLLLGGLNLLRPSAWFGRRGDYFGSKNNKRSPSHSLDYLQSKISIPSL